MICGRASSTAGLKERAVDDLLDLYAAADPSLRARVKALLRQADSPGWWTRHSDVYLDKREDGDHYLEVRDSLSTEALSPAETLDFIAKATKEL